MTSLSPESLALVVLVAFASGLAFAFVANRMSMRKRRQMEAEVERSEALFNAFFEASPAGLAILDRDLRFIRINEPMAHIHGADLASHIGQTFEHIVPDLATVVAPLMREVILTGRSIHSVEVPGRTPASGGQEGHWLVSYFPIFRKPARTPFGVGAVVLDITNRKRTELALQESENRLRNVSDHLPVAVFQYRADKDGNSGFTYISEGARTLLSHPVSELTENPEKILSCVADKDRATLKRALQRDLPTFTPSQIKWTGQRASQLGSPCWLQIRASAELLTDGRLTINGVLMDITDLKNYEHDLERSRAELRRLGAHREELVERERHRLAREFHDELGQVLTTARFHLQLLSRNLGPEQDTVRQEIHKIETLIGDAYRSVKTIASDLRPAALNLGLTAAVEWLAARIFSGTEIRYEIAFSRTADFIEDSYSIVLFRIIQESLTNIIRHAAATKVSIRLADAGDNLTLEVIDDGKGFNIDGIDRNAQFGLLGMSERTANLGGILDISSAPGNGTRLRVTLTNPVHSAT